MRAGHAISRRPGTGVPHWFVAAAGGMTHLAYGTREPNDIVYYPRVRRGPALRRGRRGYEARQRLPASTSTASSTSSSDESSSGECETPPFRLRTKSIALGTPAAASTPASCPAPEVSSTTGRPRPSISVAQRRLERRRSSRRRVGAVGRLEPERRDQTRRSRSTSGARASTSSVTRGGDHVDRARLDLDLPDGGDRVLDRPRRLLDPEDLARPLHERVVAHAHRRRPGVARAALDDDRPARTPTMPVTIAERRAGGGEPRPLLDVQLEEGARQLAARQTRARLPTQPRSSSRKTTTEPRPARSTASIAATTPSAPSNFPPWGTVSRCEPVQTPGTDPFGSVPNRLPAASTRRPRARPPRSHIRASSCAASSSGE